MTLTELRDMLAKADGPSRELDCDVYKVLTGRVGWTTAQYTPDSRRLDREYQLVRNPYDYPECVERVDVPHLTSSIDAAEELRQRLLPGSFMWLQKDRTWECRVVIPGEPAPEDTCPIVDAPTECLARLKALVEARIAKERAK